MKPTIGVFIALILGAVVVGGYYFPEQKAFVASPIGTTFSTAKVAQINWTLSTGATSTSVLNSDASDRYIQGFFIGCGSVGSSNTALTGAGLASLIITAATTSTNAPAGFSTTNAILNSTFSTSTPDLYVGSTTPGLTGSSFVRRWAAGSYLSFQSNATNTAACTIGVNYVAS